MALFIQTRKWERADGTVTTGWVLALESEKDGKRSRQYVSRKRYLNYGLSPADTVEQARAKLKITQATERLARQAVKRAKIEKRMARLELKESAYLPATLYATFLEELTERRMWDEIPPKTRSHLLCMRRMILDLDICPSDWPMRPVKLYLWFKSQKLSLSYIEKLMPLINDYGYFYCKQMSKPWLPLTLPKGDTARLIDEANLEERQGKQAPSKPILLGDLPKLEALPDEQLRWVRFSIFFGLRPKEVDMLTLANQESTWTIGRDDKGMAYLSFYQSKLIRVERARRWKRIPCILPEQLELLKELAQDLPKRRPYPKMLQKHLGDGYGTYGGRKAFEKLMKTKGQDFINISRWLGHQDIRRTERNYRELEAVDYDPVS